MSKSVFQQLVEQTCSNANFKPSNNQAAKAAVAAKPNGSARSVKNPASAQSASAADSHSTFKNQNSKFAPDEERATNNEKPAPSGAAILLAKQIRDMDAANRAPRCMHVKANGVRCASPAMRNLEFCFFHEKFYNPPYDDSFPPLEDANSVQCAILQVLNGLKTKSITPLEARVMLYGLKAASINSRRTTFEPIMEAQVIDHPGLRRQKADAHSEVSEGHGFNRDERDEGKTCTASSASPSTTEIVTPTASVGQGFSPECEPERAGPAFRVEQDFSPAKKKSNAQHTASSASSSTSTSIPPARNYSPEFEEMFPLVKKQASATAKPPASVPATQFDGKNEVTVTSN